MSNQNPELIDGFPRRSNIQYDTPIESAIRVAIEKVEKAGAHPLLTEATVLLDAARNKIADWEETRIVSFNDAMREADENGELTAEMRADWIS